MTTDKTTAVITGAPGGIGRAIARRFVESGYRLVVGDADAPGLEDLSGALNNGARNVWAKPWDLRSKAYCEELIDHAIAVTGRLDVLVNNAGIITRGNILETSDEDWARTFDLNLNAIFLTCRKAIAHMKGRGGGAIVNVSSCWGLYTGPAHAAYCTGKGVVAIFSKCLDRDHAADGIRVWRRRLATAVAIVSLAACDQFQKYVPNDLPADLRFDLPAKTRPPLNYKELVRAWIINNIPEPYSLHDVAISNPHYGSIRTGEGWIVCLLANAENSLGVYTGRKEYTFLIQDDRITSVIHQPNACQLEYTDWPEMEDQ